MEEHIKYDITKNILHNIDELYYHGFISDKEHSNIVNSLPIELIENYNKWKEFYS